MDVAIDPSIDLAINTGEYGATTTSFDLQIEGCPGASGMVALTWEGNLVGSGAYDPINFTLPELVDDMWHTSYIGGPFDVQFPVDSFFDVFFEVTVYEGMTWEPPYCLGINTTQVLVGTLPDGYELIIPEPASFVSLLIPTGLALLLRRKR